HYKTQTDNPRILIAGDEKARFGLTVAVLDEVRKAGIDKFSVETRPRATGK
ncbi:MAG: biopolymer transporter ExbD, partial [Oleiharenicola lentus]